MTSHPLRKLTKSTKWNIGLVATSIENQDKTVIRRTIGSTRYISLTKMSVYRDTVASCPFENIKEGMCDGECINKNI